MAEYAVAVTGASGAIYGLRTITVLVALGHRVHAIVSAAGATVLAHEHGVCFDPERPDAAAFLAESARVFAALGGPTRATPEPPVATGAAGLLTFHHEKDLLAPLASGSYPLAGLAVVPCSLATAGRAAAGAGNGLIERAIECALKERRRLILVPRETPLSPIALANFQTLSAAGAIVLPAMPGFYHHPASIADLVDFIVARVLDQLGVAHNLVGRWGVPPALQA